MSDDSYDPTELPSTAASQSSGDVSEHVGPYQLLEKLGEGGMGEVWLAEQQEPVKRKVALKVIKQGMDTKRVVARFEAEKQALALMEHPAIAKVFDAGATPRGRPYFAMEHVQGVPITEYCDRHRLTNRERLNLFMQVCAGVQHAHQKAVIHRDLKPGNVLVSIQDDKPVPKIIDFGVAKATGQSLTDQTMYTQLGMIIGTPAYMSPEQAEMTGQNIDTRTDVYALGVMLYELLVGALPFDPKELSKGGLESLARKIREEEPARPSTRLSTLGDHSMESAKRRQTDLPSLKRELSADLDWIVMKALEKDRTHRYASPQEFAADIGRYLSNEAVLARSPTTAYRAGKFIRRHRVGVSVAAAGVLLLLGFAATMAFQARRIAAERDRANAEREQAEQARKELELVVEFQAGMLGDLDTEGIGRRLVQDMQDRIPAGMRERGAAEPAIASAVSGFVTGVREINSTNVALRLLDEEILESAGKTIGKLFGDQPLVAAHLQNRIGVTYLDLGLYERSEPYLAAALATRARELGREDPVTLESIGELGTLLQSHGKLSEAEPYYREALDSRRRVLGDDHPQTLGSINNMGFLLQSQGKLSEAEPYFREAFAGHRRVLGDDHPDTLTSINNMGFLLQYQGKLSEAEPYFREALAGHRRVLGDDHPDTLGSINNMGALLLSQGKLSEAEPYYRESLAGYRRVLGDDHPDTLTSINNMGGLLQYQGKPSEAEPYFREALAGYRRVLGDDHPDTLTATGNLGDLYTRLGRFSEAEALLVEAVEGEQRVLGEDHWGTGTTIRKYGVCLTAQQRYAEAETALLEAHEILMAAVGAEHTQTLKVLPNLVELYEAWNKPDKAAEWRARLPAE